MKKKIVAGVIVLFWSLISAVIITYLFISTFLSEYSPIPLHDVGAMFFGPLFCGIMFGIVLKKFELPQLISSAILMSGLSLLLIFTVFIFPHFLGIDIFQTLLEIEAIKLLALSSLFIFPLSIVGAIFGKAIGDTQFLSGEEKMQLRLLKEDTKKWYEELKKK